MRFAPLAAVDRGRLLQLWNDAAAFDPLTPELLAEKLDDNVNDEPNDQPAEPLGIALLKGDQLAGWAACVLRATADGPRGVVKMLAVAPAAQGRGCGTALLAEAERRLAAAGARTVRPAESAPNYLTPGVDVRYTRAWLMLERRGYRRLGETHNLVVPLQDGAFDDGDATPRLAEAGVTLRRADPDDRPALLRLLQQHWPAWEGEVQLALQQVSPAVHLACDAEGSVVAFAAYDGNNVGTGWFGPMGTDPAHEGRGIGGALLRRCLCDLQQQGRSHATIPWVGPIRFYAKHAGAAVDRVFYRYEKALSE